MADGDVRAAAGRVAGRTDRAAERREPRIVQGDGIFGERDALGADLVDARFGNDIDPGLRGSQGDDRRRADEPAANPGTAFKRGTHRELVTLREPALDRRPKLVLELAPHVQE